MCSSPTSSDWTKSCSSKTVNIPAFIKKMQDLQAGKAVDWTCPFCGSQVVLMEHEDGKTLIGCEACDMRINLEVK